MSRGLGKLQRAILVELEKHNWTTACELIMVTHADGLATTEAGITFHETSNAHTVAVRRALHTLHKRGLVRLAHIGWRHYSSKILGRKVWLGAEVLCAWLPSNPGPKPFPGHPYRLNPKRCVPGKRGTTKHLEPAEASQ